MFKGKECVVCVWVCLFVCLSAVMKGKYVSQEKNPVSVFVLNEHIVSAALGKPLECCIHGNLKVMHMAPDLVS